MGHRRCRRGDWEAKNAERFKRNALKPIQFGVPYWSGGCYGCGVPIKVGKEFREEGQKKMFCKRCWNLRLRKAREWFAIQLLMRSIFPERYKDKKRLAHPRAIK